MTASLWNLPSPDVAEALARNPTVVLPFGSIEQHGAHLPCGTDSLIAEQLAEVYRGAGHSVTWLATAAPLRPGVTAEDGIRRIRIPGPNGLESRLGMPFPLVGPRGLRERDKERRRHEDRADRSDWCSDRCPDRSHGTEC